MPIVFLIFVLFLSVVLHEVAHGVVATWNGDATAKEQGRLTLNPIPHMDPVGTVVVPALLGLSYFLTHTLIVFGWAKPVPINPRRFRHKRLGMFTVGIAGPLTNVGLAVLLAAGVRVLLSSGAGNIVAVAYGGLAVFINLALAVFNLIPIPPLDGSRVVGVFLTGRAHRAYFGLEKWGLLIIILLMYYTGLFEHVVLPVASISFRTLTGFSPEELFYIIDSLK